MQFPRKLPLLIALLVPVLMVAWLAWVNQARIDRIAYVSGLAGGNEIAIDPGSPTGYEDGLRILIFPDDTDESYQWVLQTEQSMTSGAWRLRHVDYDNVPHGRAVVSTSAYRWWLATTAKVDQLTSGRPLALAIERAALLAGPLLHLLLLVLAGAYVSRRSSIPTGILVTILLAAAFPLSESLLGGRPTSEHLSILFALWSVLPLVAPRRASTETEPAKIDGSRFPSILAGAFGALGLWTNLALQAPILIGIAVSGLAVSLFPLFGLPALAGGAPHWRRWGLAGAAMSLLCYLVEYFPGHLGWSDLWKNLPAYAIAWLLVGELLHQVATRLKRRPPNIPANRIVVGIVALVLLLVPVLLILDSARGFLPFHAVGTRLAGTLLDSDLLTWTARHGTGFVTLATVLPFLILLPSIWCAVGAWKNRSGVAPLLIAWGPAGITLAMALLNPLWWPVAAVLLVPVLVTSMASATSARSDKQANWIWAGIVLVAVLPGAWLHYALAKDATDSAVSEAEVAVLVERNLSHWLARQVGPAGANVLAPPHLTVSLIFHGGLAGLSTPFVGNQEGFAAAVRIAAATSADEAEALTESRKLTHIIVPSWDDTLDDYARLGATEEESTLMAMLHRWLAPRWLAPVSYLIPQVEGFEEDYAAIFRVVEVQDNATALSRLAVYFLEMRQNEAAVSVGQTLENSFPGDLNALISRAEIALAQRDSVVFKSVMDQLVSLLEGGMGDYLVWDRRVSLAVMLARHRSMSLALQQLEICLEEVDESLIRSLSTVFVFRLVSMMQAFDLEFDDPDLRTIALKLLPEEMRARL